ncbi:hypothetical protein CL629_04500 [bacterium]|nr:hypothetical protein [bacterium]|tara:strand:- start:3808 stop:4866 length:1059 start_codon:yes stop_codon:yes gene_type:complete
MENNTYKKIVVVGPNHPDSLPKCTYIALQDMGYSVSLVDDRAIMGGSYAKDIEKRGNPRRSTLIKLRIKEARMQLSPKYEEKVFQKVADKVIEHEPDLVIIHNGRTPAHTIKRIKERAKAKVILWFADHPANLGRQYMFLAQYDAMFFKDKYIVDMARRINLPAYYLPESVMPKWHKKVELTEEEKKIYSCEITTAGNMYPYRARIFEELTKEFDVKLWGPSIPKWLYSKAIRKAHQHKSVMELDKAKAFAGADIVVNTFQAEVQGVNLRTFEAAACSAFQICEYRKELEELFEIGKEIVVFKNIDELKEKVRYYLKNPEERKNIAEAGMRRAQSYTYAHRIEEIFQTLKNI